MVGVKMKLIEICRYTLRKTMCDTDETKNLNSKKEENNMATIAEASKEYTSSQTMNIADLEKVSTDLQLVEDEFEFADRITGQMKKVQQEVVIIDEIKYRCPVTVKQQLKIILEDSPALKYFKVKKTGEGKESTKYQVIPLMA